MNYITHYLLTFKSYLNEYSIDKRNLQGGLSVAIFAASTILSVPSGNAQGAVSEAVPKITVGSKVSLSSVGKADWIQGEAPESCEPGHVYIFECWSTRCVPCIALIPHMNELHKKYYDKGLRVYGMSVYENEKDKVVKFVEKKGDKMSYPVAFTGKGGPFEIEFLRAAGGRGIPHALVVRDGILIASTQASRLDEHLIELMLSGDEGAKQASEEISSAQSYESKIYNLIEDFNRARKKKELDKMTTALDGLRELEPEHPTLHMHELWILIVGKKWPEAIKALNEMPASDPKRSFLSRTSRLARHDIKHYPEDFEKALIKSYADYVTRNEFPIGPNHYAALSMLQWKIGEKEKALETANMIVESAKYWSPDNQAGVTPYVRFAKAVNEGTMPKFSDLSTWHREAK